MSHPLHKRVGSSISLLNSERTKVLLDNACCENLEDVEVHNISLFFNEKSNSSKLCNVDALILYDQKVKIIIEIDESNSSPNNIFGKFLTSAFSNLYQYNNEKISIPEKSVLFIQVVDTSKYPLNSKRVSKLRLIEKRIQQKQIGIIKEYALLTDKEITQLNSLIVRFIKEN